MKNIIYFGLLCVFACSGGNEQPGEGVEVFNKAVAVPCGSNFPITPDQSEQILTNAGIEVFSSRCSFVVDDSDSVECDMFEIINIYEVSGEYVEDAANVGYQELNRLSSVYGLSESDLECGGE